MKSELGMHIKIKKAEIAGNYEYDLSKMEGNYTDISLSSFISSCSYASRGLTRISFFRLNHILPDETKAVATDYMFLVVTLVVQIFRISNITLVENFRMELNWHLILYENDVE